MHRTSVRAIGASFCVLTSLSVVWPSLAQESRSRIPIEITLDAPGEVTLVIEDADGKRVRNLISQEPMAAGQHTVWWDGQDDLLRDRDAAKHAVFHIPGQMVAPGEYTVRGLVHPEIDLVYRLTPYTNGNPPWKTKDHGSQWLTNHSAPSDVVFLPAGVAPVREGKPSSAGGQLLVCSRVAEGGSGLAWLDLDGNKLWGQHWLGGVWTAASHLAVDHGDNPVDGVYAYAAASWQGDKYNNYQSELRLHKLVALDKAGKAPRDARMGTGEDQPVVLPFYKVPDIEGAPAELPNNEKERKAIRRQFAAELSGMAVYNGLVICSFQKINQLVFIDAHNAEIVGTAELPNPRGMAFDREGRLVVLSGGKVLRFNLDASKPNQLSAAEELVTGLEDPQYLAISEDGDLFISDWGDSHQVKRFASDGTRSGTIGDPGAPQIGHYNRNHMNHPAGMTLDDHGRLWVAENSHTPKRVSVWNLNDGSLADAFYGPMRYGGSGAVDPQDASRFFYDDDHGGTLVFRLDYEKASSEPISIAYLEEYNKTGLIGGYTGAAPSYPLYHDQQPYLTDAYNLHTTGRRSAMLYRYDEQDGIARIVAAAGNVYFSHQRLLPAFERDDMQAVMPEGYTAKGTRSLLYVWSDMNGNQQLEPDEVQFLRPEEHAVDTSKPAKMGNVSITDDLAFTFAMVGDDVVRFSPTAVSSDGVPRYDITKREVLATGAQSPASSGGGQVLPADDGWLITTTPLEPFAREGLGGARHGEPMWSYPSLWPGLHASHIAPMPEGPGQVIGTTRVIGTVIDAPEPSDAGQFWAINANKGTIYVFTTDGLFVARLFEDSRRTSWDAPEAIPGMLVNDMSLQEECFGPTWTATEDGRVFLQAHFTGNIVEIKNLDQVRRLEDQQLTVSGSQLLAAMQWNIEEEAARQKAEADKTTTLTARVLQDAPVIDGKADEWKDAQWASIDKRTQKVGNWGKHDIETKASIAFADGKLYAVWKTYDADLLRNTGEQLNNLFKSGGCLDLFISADADADPQRREPVKGDQRVLITQVEGQLVAVLYEPVSPGYDAPAVEFGSPLRTLRFDRVEVISNQVQLATTTEEDTNGDKVVETTYEVSIPLHVLGFEPRVGSTRKFDIGVLRGNGSQTLQRVYWTNHAAGIVSDIPSEAELIPALWGELQVEK